MESKKARSIGMTALVAALLGLIWLSGCTSEGAKLNLRFKVQEGESYHLRMSMDQHITQSMEGMESEITQTMGFGCVFTTTEVDADGNAWLDMVYDWISVEQDSAMGSFKYNSDAPDGEAPQAALGFVALLNKGFEMQVAPSGEILALRGIEEMLDEMLVELEVPEEQREQLKEQLGGEFNEESLMEQMGQIVIEYPEGEVRIGDTWTSTAKAGGSMPLIITATYTLQAVEEGVATVGVTSTLTSDPEAEAMDLESYKLRYAITGVQEGVIKVDIASGWSQNSAITQTVSGEMIFITEEEEMSIPLSLLSVVKVEMVK